MKININSVWQLLVLLVCLVFPHFNINHTVQAVQLQTVVLQTVEPYWDCSHAGHCQVFTNGMNKKNGYINQLTLCLGAIWEKLQTLKTLQLKSISSSGLLLFIVAAFMKSR